MKILVVGLGYIGISTALYFTKAGAEVHGVDLDIDKLNQINLGEMPQKDLEKWLDFKPKKYLKKLKVSHHFAQLKEPIYDAIFVAIPTEKNGEPWFEPLQDVVQHIKESKNKDSLVIIESTLMPGISEKYIKPHLKNFVVAGRRDWFTEKNKTLETLPRIVGGNTKKNTKKAMKILGKVCKILHPCDFKESELVKSCENSIRHLGAMYATQLAFAYPNLDTKKILELASTKWNTPYYYANCFGASGYCIGISSKYVKLGAKKKGELTLLTEAIKTNDNITKKTAEIIKKKNPKIIGILGMAYLGDIKVFVECGCLKLLKYLKDYDIQINDPLYTDGEIKTISGRKSFKIPDDLDQFDVLIITAGHSYYKNIDEKLLIEKTKNCKYILDNSENKIWQNVDFKCNYKMVGERNWME